MLGARRAFALEPVSQHVLNAADWELAYAAQLRTAFFEGKLLEADAFPAELRNTSGPLLAAADRIQHLALTGMRMQRVGYKIGATNVAAQTGLTLTTPFLGPVLAESLFDSPASVTATGRHVRGVEAEFGFEMKNTLMPVRL